MCTGAEIALLASTAISVGGSVASGNAQARAAAFQATVQRQQAERQRQIAAVQEAQLRARHAREQGRQRALLAARGIIPSSGTALLTLEQAEAENEFNALLRRSSADARAIGFEQDALLSNARGSAARTQGFVSAGSTLLKAAGSKEAKIVSKAIFGP